MINTDAVLIYVTCFIAEDDDDLLLTSCFTNVQLSKVLQVDHNQLLIEWSYCCSDSDNCTHFNLSVQRCSNSSDIAHHIISIDSNNTCINLPSDTHEDIVISMQICTNNTSSECKQIERCNRNAIRINTFVEGIQILLYSKLIPFIIGTQIPVDNGKPCFNSSFFIPFSGITPDVLINGIAYNLPRVQAPPLYVIGTGNSIAYDYNGVGLSLCILNTTEAERLFGTPIILQERISCTTCICNNHDTDCSVLRIGAQMIYGNRSDSEGI